MSAPATPTHLDWQGAADRFFFLPYPPHNPVMFYVGYRPGLTGTAKSLADKIKADDPNKKGFFTPSRNDRIDNYEIGGGIVPGL